MSKKKAPVAAKPQNSPFSSMISNAAIFGLAAVYLGVMLKIANKINDIQPVTYLDEIYHIPQAIEYCKGNFSHWDDRITTLPGVYLITIAILKPIAYVTGQDLCDISDIPFYRATNILLSLANFFLYIWMIQKINHLDKGYCKWKGLLSALNVALFPPLFFFAYLYYTDVAAASLVFLMFSLYLNGSNFWAALAGVAAILMRQTSIVWTVLVAVGCLDSTLQNHLFTQKEQSNKELMSSWRKLQGILIRFFRLSPFSKKAQLVGQLLRELLPYILVGALFIGFVYINDGLVVGDRSAHQATINMPQLFYYFGLVTIFAAPHWLSHIRPFLNSCLSKWYLVLLATGIAVMVIRFNTIVHPYLLADNRHYTFYVWKRVFEYHPMGRYLVIPFYLFGAYVSYKTMTEKRGFIFTVAFIFCCIVALVPQRLLEIRYFFIPFLLLRLHVSPRSWAVLVLELLMFILVNAATLYLFMYRPFYWADSPLVQRFMW